MHTSGWVWYREADDAHAREDNARLRAVLGHCPRCIAVLDQEGNLAGFNREFQSLFSVPLPLGGPVAQLFAERPRAMLAEVVATAGTRERAGAMISMRTTAGEEHELELLIATLPGEGARTTGVVMSAEDRTERIHEESERALMARAIGDANTRGAINLAQAAMCHDVNNVLSVLTLTVGSLKAVCGTANPQVTELLGELAGAVKHGAEIVARAKATARAAVARRESAGVRECVGRAAQVVAPLARKAKGRPGGERGERRARRAGRDAAHPGPHQPDDQLRSRHPGRGPGGAHRGDGGLRQRRRRHPRRPRRRRRHRALLLVDSFEAFQTTRAERGGTGLGLAIARETIEGAGGHIDVLSTPGRATEMRLELPATRCSKSAVAVA
jgi:PAS domain S-box-containing protein